MALATCRPPQIGLINRSGPTDLCCKRCSSDHDSVSATAHIKLLVLTVVNFVLYSKSKVSLIAWLCTGEWSCALPQLRLYTLHNNTVTTKWASEWDWTRESFSLTVFPLSHQGRVLHWHRAATFITGWQVYEARTYNCGSVFGWLFARATAICLSVSNEIHVGAFLPSTAFVCGVKLMYYKLFV